MRKLTPTEDAQLVMQLIRSGNASNITTREATVLADEVDRLRGLLLGVGPEPVQPPALFRHYKGGLYEVLHGKAVMEHNLKECVVYRAASAEHGGEATDKAKVWIRYRHEGPSPFFGVVEVDRFEREPSVSAP